MKLIRTWLLCSIGLLVLASCGLFRPQQPYDQGDRNDPIVLDQPHPEKRRADKEDGHKPIDYLLPWRLLSAKD